VITNISQPLTCRRLILTHAGDHAKPHALEYSLSIVSVNQCAILRARQIGDCRNLISSPTDAAAHGPLARSPGIKVRLGVYTIDLVHGKEERRYNGYKNCAGGLAVGGHDDQVGSVDLSWGCDPIAAKS
jgi:hypothetical protein